MGRVPLLGTKVNGIQPILHTWPKVSFMWNMVLDFEFIEGKTRTDPLNGVSFFCRCNAWQNVLRRQMLHRQETPNMYFVFRAMDYFQLFFQWRKWVLRSRHFMFTNFWSLILFFSTRNDWRNIVAPTEKMRHESVNMYLDTCKTLFFQFLLMYMIL